MTLVKKGSRQIVVDGDTYRWRVRHKPGYSQGNGWTPLTFAVEAAAAPGRTLVVRTGYAHPENWLGLPTSAVRPADVAQAVRNALLRGWSPDAAGSPFILDLTTEPTRASTVPPASR